MYALMETTRQLGNENGTLKARLQAVKKERDALKAHVGAVREEGETLRAELKTVKEGRDAVRADLQAEREEGEALRDQLQAAREEVAGIRAERAKDQAKAKRPGRGRCKGMVCNFCILAIAMAVCFATGFFFGAQTAFSLFTEDLLVLPEVAQGNTVPKEWLHVAGNPITQDVVLPQQEEPNTAPPTEEVPGAAPIEEVPSAAPPTEEVPSATPPTQEVPSPAPTEEVPSAAPPPEQPPQSEQDSRLPVVVHRPARIEAVDSGTLAGPSAHAAAPASMGSLVLGAMTTSLCALVGMLLVSAITYPRPVAANDPVAVDDFVLVTTSHQMSGPPRPRAAFSLAILVQAGYGAVRVAVRAVWGVFF